MEPAMSKPICEPMISRGRSARCARHAIATATRRTFYRRWRMCAAKGKFVDLIGQFQPSDRAPSVESKVRLAIGRSRGRGAPRRAEWSPPCRDDAFAEKAEAEKLLQQLKNG